MTIVAFAPARKSKPCPAAFPIYSDDPAVEAAVDEDRACLWPCSEGYKANMGQLADRADRSARLVADMGSLRSVTVDPADAESDPALWPGWTDEDRWATAEPRTRARSDWTDADQHQHSCL